MTRRPTIDPAALCALLSGLGATDCSRLPRRLFERLAQERREHLETDGSAVVAQVRQQLVAGAWVG